MNLLRQLSKHLMPTPEEPLGKKLIEFATIALNDKAIIKVSSTTAEKLFFNHKKYQPISQYPPPKPFTPIHINPPFNWMSFHPIEVARQITLIDFELYQKLSFTDLYHYDKSDNTIQSSLDSIFKFSIQVKR